MRRRFDAVVEEGRAKDGPYATAAGARSGAFNLFCPATRRSLTVLASDGSEWERDGLPGPAWEHVSVSTRDRCPLWAELCWVKSLFFEDEECVLEFHPPRSKYVNCHPHVLHLWRPVGVEIPMPPLECV